MNEPSRWHIEAVARAIAGQRPADVPYRWSVEDAAHLLVSSEPAVLDAMQDALVRAGRLRVERSGVCDDEEHTVRLERRLVTDWQEDQ